MNNKRRDFIKMAGLTGLGLASSNFVTANNPAIITDATKDTGFIEEDTLQPLNRFPRNVHEYFVNKVRDIETTANERRAALTSRSDAEEYVKNVREKIMQCFGPFPEKTPLNAKLTGTLKRKEYIIEKVIFESRPGFAVTANLYIPRGRKFPLPGVIGTCGHTRNGKAGYQSFGLGLVKKGYIVLIFDPVGQGERLEYLNKDLNPMHGFNTAHHNYVGAQMYLTGEKLSTWFAWDGIRAIDYLMTRKEVDPNHIGVTGNSGGGTQATWLCGLDPRITMAAPSCFVTTFRRNLENEEAADSEQCPWGALSAGLDHSDFIAAMAPKPVILLGAEMDFFDARGLEESYERLKKLYRLLGAEDNIQLFISQNYHGYSQAQREAMYGWFNQVTNVSDNSTESASDMEKDEDLWCTPRGQVNELGYKYIFSFTSSLAIEQKEKRGNLQGSELFDAVKKVLRLPSYDGIPYYRILRPQGKARLYPATNAGNYAVETEAGIFVMLYRLHNDRLTSRIPRGLQKAILYISDISADDELRNEPLLKEMAGNMDDTAIFACDVRGTGELQPNTAIQNFFHPYGSDYMYAAYSLMLNYPYTGQKTFDILKIINLLKAYGHTDIHLVAKGRGAVPGTFAALLSDDVKQITLKNAPESFGLIAGSEDYDWPLSALVPGVLKNFDLTDCYKELNSKRLKLIEPRGAIL